MDSNRSEFLPWGLDEYEFKDYHLPVDSTVWLYEDETDNIYLEELDLINLDPIEDFLIEDFDSLVNNLDFLEIG
jgi:hypothetical protein